MKLLWSTKDEKGENVSHLQITEVLLIRIVNIVNILNNDYQQDLRVLHTLLLNKSFGQLLDISTQEFYIFKTF